MEPLSPTNPGCMMLLFFSAFLALFGLAIIPASSTSTMMIEPSIAIEQPQVYSSFANADVTYVRAVQDGSDTWTFYVTVAHPDTGWEDYADGWDVVLPDGSTVLVNPGEMFTRLLTHPHEAEQPFTRSQSGITIPAGVTRVRVRAHDLVDGFGGREVWVDLSPDAAGDDFEVQRN